MPSLWYLRAEHYMRGLSDGNNDVNKSISFVDIVVNNVSSSMTQELCAWFTLCCILLWFETTVTFTHILQDHFDGLVQDCSISSALAMEILQSCTKPPTCGFILWAAL